MSEFCNPDPGAAIQSAEAGYLSTQPEPLANDQPSNPYSFVAPEDLYTDWYTHLAESFDSTQASWGGHTPVPSSSNMLLVKAALPTMTRPCGVEEAMRLTGNWSVGDSYPPSQSHFSSIGQAGDTVQEVQSPSENHLLPSNEDGSLSSSLPLERSDISRSRQGDPSIESTRGRHVCGSW